MQALASNAAERFWNGGGRIRIVDRCLLGERYSLGEGRDQSDANRPHVAGGRDDARSGFWCIVGVAAAGERIRFGDCHDLIGREFQLIAAGEHVRRLDAAVHESLAVQVGERVQEGEAAAR